MPADKTYSLTVIGRMTIRNSRSVISLDPKFQKGLKEIEHFSHLRLFWWDGADLQLSTVPMEEVTKNELIIGAHDIPEHAPILDLKAYIPVEDRVRDCRVPPKQKRSRQKKQFLNTKEGHFSLDAIGEVVQKNSTIQIKINKGHIDQITALKGCSHLKLVWFCNRFDNPTLRKTLICKPPYEAPKTGVFASRAPVRPNPIALTVSAIQKLDPKRGLIELDACDAFSGSPVLQILPYLPSVDRIDDCRVPQWLSHWPKWRQEDESANHPLSIREADIHTLSHLQATAPGSNSSQKTQKSSPAKKGKRNAINLFGARQHNLKNIDISIPLGKLTVVTGVSGSGKSSLAFDTIYAEARRRYMQSLSTSSRMAAGALEKPDFDNIQNLLPAVAIEQKRIHNNPRSTVGTISDVYSYLRLLFARLGSRHCTRCGTEIAPQSAESLYQIISSLLPGTTAQFAPGKTIADDVQMENFTIGSDSTEKLYGIITRCYSEGDGFLSIIINGRTTIRVTERTACTNCDAVLFKMSPSLFSYNSPVGMCPTCNGLGQKLEVDPEKVISDPDLSLLDGASAWYGDLRKHRNKPNANWFRNEILALAAATGVDLELTWKKLPKDFKNTALYGSGDKEYQYSYSSGKTGRSGTITRPIGGAVNHIRRLFSNSKANNSHEVYRQFLTQSRCPDCQGERLAADGRQVTLAGRRFPEIASMTIEQAGDWITQLPKLLSSESRTAAENLLSELTTRLESLLQVGLYYLSLDRPVTSLSGGEAQRIKLANQLGCGLSGLLYVLDEPSIGLHPADHRQMITTMQKLRDSGNTLLVVEHDEETILAADQIIDIGEGAGIYGGSIIARGTPEQIRKNAKSITGRFLQSDRKVALPDVPDPKKWIAIHGANLHNLKDVTAKFPIGRVSCVTGVSGSGKSSLLRGILVPALQKKLNRMEVESSHYTKITGLQHLDRIINIDQTAIGRSPRSIPATYTGLFDEIRTLFAGTEEAKKRKFKNTRFSFNDKKGRCPKCEGAGKIKVDMSFLPDTWIRCSDCNGMRYNRETLEIAYNGKNIAEVLNMEVEEAIDFFNGNHKILQHLQVLSDVGLDYLKLGQRTTSLSGGEAQRLKLARELVKQEAGRNLYVLDEPTTGLHFSDISKLLTILHKLAAMGNTVLIIEHNLTVIKASHWIVDLGPSGGDKGGTVIGQGTPEEIANTAGSVTGSYLKKHRLNIGHG